MRIVSLLAGGTELVCALGQGAALVGRSHECDDPPWVTCLPALSQPTFDVTGSSREIDRLVNERLRAGRALYAIDADRLRALAPDIVVTQVHCDVCAVSPTQLDPAHGWPALRGVQTVSMRGGSLEGILADFAEVARALGCPEAGDRLTSELRARLARWRGTWPRDATPVTSARPRVVCLEWIDPIFPMGNWGPELVELAGGTCALGNPRSHSAATTWQAVVDADPEVLVVAPCGFALERAWAEMPSLAARPGFEDLRAVRMGEVYVADGNRYFNRSGPSVFESVDLLAEILHPEVAGRPSEGRLFRRWPSTEAPAENDRPSFDETTSPT